LLDVPCAKESRNELARKWRSDRKALNAPLIVAFSTSQRERSDGSSHRRGKTNSPQQILERRIRSQVVHGRIEVRVEEPVGVIVITLFQIFEGALVFSQADVDSSEVVRRNIFPFC